MWSFLLSLFTGSGGIVGSITKEIDKAREDRFKATNDADRITLDTHIATLEAQKSVLVAEAQAGDRTSSLVRGLLVSPVIVFLWKVMVYDKALGEWTHGRTDAVPPEMWTLVMVMIGFYFVHDFATRKGT